MSETPPDAYCFFQDIKPRDPMVARFDYDYLLHAVKGALNVEIGDQRWLLPRSFAAWVPANTEIKVILDRPATSCSILSKPGLVTDFPDHPVVFQMSNLTREMAHHCRGWGKSDLHPPAAASFFKALLSTCAELVACSIDVARPSTDDPFLARAIAFTEENLSTRLSVAAVARHIGMSERSMQRKLTSHLGLTWSQMLTRLRMIHAVELLSDNDKPIIQIAADCGYTSVSAFNHSFKTYARITPSEFRKRIV